MMLTKYKEPPKKTTGQTRTRGKKKEAPPEEDGTRKDASVFFDKFPDQIRATLLNATVYLESPGGGKGSGVILGVNDTKAFILTAKHNLFTLAGQTKPEDKRTKAFKKPNEYSLANDYGREGIKVTYGPAQLLAVPANEAVPVTGFNFADVAGSGDAWTYDAMLFEVENLAFRTFVTTNRFIKKDNYKRCETILDRVKGAYLLLDRRLKHIQLGYGKARDDNMDIDRDNYTSYEGKVQCKSSSPSFSTTAPVLLYEPNTQERDRSKWRSMSHAIELDASVTNSTAPGDSGGPLFAVTSPKSGDREVFLVGVTSGANFYGDPTRLDSPPSERKINNNVATYWHEIFKYCAFLDRT
jgi:hypothetical protein